MHSERQLKLLQGLVEDLEDGQAPLNQQFLVENGVTYDESHDLIDLVGTIVRGYVNLPSSMKAKVILSSAINNAEMVKSAMAHYDHVEGLKQFRKTLEEMNKKDG